MGLQEFLAYSKHGEVVSCAIQLFQRRFRHREMNLVGHAHNSHLDQSLPSVTVWLNHP